MEGGQGAPEPPSNGAHEPFGAPIAPAVPVGHRPGLPPPVGIPAMNPPPEVHRSTTVGVKEEETRWAGPPIEPPPPRFSSPPAVMPVTAAVAAAKAVAAEMLAAPVAETRDLEIIAEYFQIYDTQIQTHLKQAGQTQQYLELRGGNIASFLKQFIPASQGGAC